MHCDYHAYFFDLDGTLLDTNELIYQCFVRSCGRFVTGGISREQVSANTGIPLREQIVMNIGPRPEQELEAIMKEHMTYQLEIYPRYLTALPTVRNGLAKLKDRGKHCLIVTSRRRHTCELYLQETGLLPFFTHLVTPESTTRHKPHPEPVLKACELARCTPQDTLFIGDTEYDIECGCRAGSATALVAWSKQNPSTFSYKPSFLLQSIDDLIP